MHDTGFNEVQISKQLNIFRCCVQNLLNKYKRLGKYDDSKRAGRPKRLDAHGFWHLKQLVKDDARLSTTKIASDLNASLPNPVTTRTVRAYLKKLTFEYVIKMKKQWLGVQHLQQRIAGCTKHMNWTLSVWKNMIFSDESALYVLKRKNQCKIWRLE